MPLNASTPCWTFWIVGFGFNIGVELVVKTVCGQNVGYFGGNLEFYEIRVGTYECLF